MKTRIAGRVAAVILLVGGLGACATEGEPEYGSSVRHMISGQTYNPAAPATNAVSTTDGERAGTAVKVYRTDRRANEQTPASALVIPIQQ